MALIITSNYNERQFLYGYELTEEELAEFDYIPDEQLSYHNFIKYRGQIIDPNEFTAIDTGRDALPDGFNHWHGYQPDTFFSGLLIRYCEDTDYYQIASYFS